MDTITAGILGAMGASVIGGLSTHAAARVQSRRYKSQNQLDQSNATKVIAEAATEAVSLVRGATEEAERRLTAMATDLQAARDELAAVRRELAEAREELHTAIAARNRAQETIEQLRSEVSRLRARVVELEARVGGRRDGDAPAPALRGPDNE